MKTKLHILFIITLSLVCLILSRDGDVALAASDWFVRPAGGNYGSEDGSSYQDAWDGLSSVVWGPGGVEAGDTLYVCGLHLRSYTRIPQWEIIGPVTSGTSDSNRVTIRGDFPGDQGIIWGAGILAVNSWSYEGDNTYSMNYPSSHKSNWVFEDVIATSWTVLDRKGSIQECKNTPGSFYMDTSARIIYVHCSHNGDPTNRIAVNQAGYYFNLGNVRYVTFKNLEAYCDVAHNMFVNGLDHDNANHIRFDGVTKWYAGAAVMHFRPGNDNIEFYNCDLAWAANGLDFSEGGGAGDGSTSPSNCIISGNTIHDIGVTYTDVDAHAVSWQGGRNNLIEKNEMYNCGTTICLYQLNNQSVQNTTIRWNYIHDSHTLGGANGFGIELACEDDDRHNNTGNAIYGNIVANCTTAYRYKYVQEHPFYNNIAYNCRTSFYFLRNSHPDGISYNVKMRNNISLFPTNYHIEARTSTTDVYVLDSDYNIFYPDTGSKFLLADLGSTKTMDFSGWQSLVRAGCTFDPHSIVADPLFVDPENGNFNLMPGSPAIDAGVNVGLTEDFEGNSIPLGTAPDIGAYEYVASPPPPNQPPIADAGLDQTITDKDKDGSERVTLDGSASRDPDGTIVSFIWSEGGLEIATGKNPTVSLSTGTHSITLTVADDGGSTDNDTVTIKVLEGDEEFGELPAGCYNNVFNPTKGERALIVVELAKQSHVRLGLYNAKGNKIRELADEQKEAGTHKYYWDGKSSNGDVVGSGLYFIHIQAGDYKKTKKIVVVK